MLSEVDFTFIARNVKQRSGLAITPDKAYLLETRLAALARREGHAGVQELAAAARVARDDRLIWLITDALTTHETFFFRDKTPFDLLREQIIPAVIKKKGAVSRMRIWCAAASTGQEPYSIAMLMDELRSFGRGCEAEIVATDISDRVLEKARAGVYSQFEVQRGLPIQNLAKYFEKSGEMWRINDKMRAMVRFQKHNLLDDCRHLGRFDIVLCRNVLIYFEPDQKKAALERIASNMTDDGYLLLGAAEAVTGVTDAFQPSPAARSLYQRNAKWRVFAA
jgi:chemotaxis protein methyltransferase CheR